MENNKETKSDPFAGFISSSYQNGELVQEKAPAERTEVSEGSGGPDAGGNSTTAENPKPAAKPAGAVEPAVGGAPADSGDDTDDSDDADEAAEGEEEKPKPKKSVGDRIGELTRARRDAERRAAAAEEALANINRGKATAQDDEGELTEEKKPSKQAKEDKRPDPKDYEFGELDQKYLDDVVDYKVDQKLTAAEAKREETRQREAATAEQSRLKGRFDAMMAKGEEDFDDWSDHVPKLVGDTGLSLSTDLIELILETEPEVGAKITHHLATNPKEARQIAGLPPRGQAAYFGRLEARFSASAEVRQPTEKAPEVPPPVKQPRGAGGKFGFDPATANFAEFEAGAKRVLKQS